jgi:FdrA protein
MVVRAMVGPSTYLDSVVLLHLARALRARPGVREAAALMGTPTNHGLLRAARLATAETGVAGAGDLVVAVGADSDDAATAALAAAQEWLGSRRRLSLPGSDGSHAARVRPRTLDSARRWLPDANLAAVSVPGAYAAAEARRALHRGLHVFLFSDNVALADEVVLKTLAARRGLLCMGPDCGTAYVGGVGLGFWNTVPRGRVGVVAASGTGLQAVATALARRGEGISQGIGVGGRDLSAAVGGSMTTRAVGALGRDPGTALVVVVAKSPDPSAMPVLQAALGALGKPAVVCALGAPTDGPGQWVESVDDAAAAAVAWLRGVPWVPRAFDDPGAVRARLADVQRAGWRSGGTILGLYTGGTLAAEARQILAPLVGPVAPTLDPGDGRHRVVDLGAEAYTVGRPHPMLDPEARAAHVREAGRAGDVSVLLLDVVLGWGGHPDPAGPLAAAIRAAREAARARRRVLAVVASVVGTPGDPQVLEGQARALAEAGAVVLPSNAEAARLAALLVRPDLEASLFSDGLTSPGASNGQTGPPKLGDASEARGGVSPRAEAEVTTTPDRPVDQLLATPPRVLNVGLEGFAEDLARAGVAVVHADWRPPAGGDPRLAALLERLDDGADDPERDPP